MSRIIMALIVIGGTLVFLSVQDMRLSATAKNEPQQITCAALEQSGPGDNAHIVLKDFLLCDFAYVYEESSPGNWKNVWVPAVPLGGQYHQDLLSKVDNEGNLVGDMPMPTNIKVIVKSNAVSNADELTQFAGQESLQGMVVNLISSLGSKERDLLKESYPAVDFDDCYIVEVGRQPAGTGKLLATGVGGLALMGVGGVMFLARRRSA